MVDCNKPVVPNLGYTNFLLTIIVVSDHLIMAIGVVTTGVV